MKTEPLKIALLGAGGRGEGYGRFLLRNPHLGRYVAVAESDDIRRAALARTHNIPEKFCFRTWQELIAAQPKAEAVFNCLQDALHADSAMAVLSAGYHQLLEKPMAATPHDCVRIVKKAGSAGKILAICHVLRYAPFFQALKQLLTSSRVGRIICVEHKENVAFWHYTYGFVRGPWSIAAESSPMILSKSCHDMDLLVYLIAKRPVRLSSFGALTWFRPENAPAGATDRCLDGCPAEPNCPYSVQKIHIGANIGGEIPGWAAHAGMIGIEPTYENKIRHLNSTRYGLCVYKAGNDVVDHQTVMIEFEDGITVNFLMHAFCHTPGRERTMRYGCSMADIQGDLRRNEIGVTYFKDGRQDLIVPGRLPGGHAGGDTAMMRQFMEAMLSRDSSKILTNAEVSLESHLLCFAAEESRLNNGRVIELDAYRKRIEKEIKEGRKRSA